MHPFLSFYYIILYFHLTYTQLLDDLHVAYYDARRHKRNKPYQQRFESHAEENLRELCDELWNRTYQPRPSTCFVITDPKRREVFAAQFRDHLFLDVNEENTIICDVRQGVSFLGAYLKPHRRYVCNSTLHRLEAKVPSLQRKKTPELLRSSLNSFLGLLSHYRSYRLRRKMFYGLQYVYQHGHYLRWMRKYVTSTHILYYLFDSCSLYCKYYFLLSGMIFQ